MKTFKSQFTLIMAIAFLLSLVSCNDSDKKKKKNISEENEHIVINIDASDYENYVYYNLEMLKKVNVSNPESDTNWHVAFKRTNIKLNGGDSGIGNVVGALLAQNSDFYNSENEPVVSAFVNATAKSELETFIKAKAGDELTGYESDANSPAIDGDSIGGTHWYNYNFINHTISVNDSNYWLVRSADGLNYAELRAVDITMFVEEENPLSGRVMSSMDLGISFEGEEGFEEEQVIELEFSGTSPRCVVLASTATTNDCSGAWDLYVDPGLDIFLNSGVVGGGSGAAYKLTESGEYESGSELVSYAWSVDTTTGIFSQQSWYEYAVTGSESDHNLWSNYNVYAIDTDATDEDSVKVKAQILSYYNKEGNSAHYSIRIDEL